MRSKITIYTDGSCLGNPGPGGWAALLIFKQQNKKITKIIKGSKKETTNNQMEILAPTKALNQLKKPCDVNLYSDSKYVISGITEWIHNWKTNNWRTASKKPVANAEFWQELDLACARHKIKWHWVKAHAGQPENETVDEAARNEALKASKR